MTRELAGWRNQPSKLPLRSGPMRNQRIVEAVAAGLLIVLACVVVVQFCVYVLPAMELPS